MAKRTNRGRRNKYDTHVKPRFDEIRKWCEIGASDKEIVEMLGISTSTFYDYQQRYAEFSELIKSSRKKPIMEIKAALYRRAVGYTYEERRESYSEKDGISTLTITKQALPDPASAMILLKHWAKDEGWTNDPQQLELRKQELELRKQQAEREDW